MRSYRNVVLDLLESFIEYSLYMVPKDQNILPDGLATSTSTCKMPYRPSHQYTVEVKNRPIVPNSIRYWKVFGNDVEIESILHSRDEFEYANIDI